MDDMKVCRVMCIVVSDVLLWTPSHGRARVGRLARTNPQLNTDTGCDLENLPGAMDERDEWRLRFREIRASCTTWWCWKILRFYPTLIFYPICYLCVCWSCNGIKERKGKKTRISLYSALIFGVHNNFVMGMFFWSSRNSCAPQSSRFENIMESFLANFKFEDPRCVFIG